jgi:hypothetical protein
MRYNDMGLLAVLALLLLIFLPCTQAVIVSGVIFNPEVNAGEHVSHEITVSQKSTENATDLTIDLYDWNQTIDGSNIVGEEGSVKTPYSAKSFLNVTPSSLHLEPGSTKKILVEGDIPADTSPGGRYAIVSIMDSPKLAGKGEGTAGLVSVVVGYKALIMIKVRGDILQTAEITDLSVEKPISPKQQNVTMTLKNTGNFHYKPDIELAIKDKNGNTLANDTLVANSSIIPPFSHNFRLSLKPENGLEPGKYLISARVSLKDGTKIASKEMEIEIKT